MTGGLRLALRLAWRNARSHRVATALTAVLVAVPVVALVAAAVLARSVQITPAEQDRRTLGTADVEIFGNINGVNVPPPLPAGSRVLTTSTDQGILTDGRRGQVDRRGLSYDAPLAAGIIHQRAGRAPRNAEEVVATTYLAKRLHLSLGEVLHLRGEPRGLTVVGTVVDPSDTQGRTLIGPSGSLSRTAGVEYLVGLPAGVTGQNLQLPQSYSVQPRSTEYPQGGSGLTPDTLNAGALVVVLALLEAALTAGTAFAVGARRGRRDLALVAVNGGGDGQIAAMVFANGIVCGVIGVVAGVVLGIGAGIAGLPILQRHTAALLDGVRIDPRLVAAAALFGFVSSLLACILPARLAARSSLRSALGGARGATGTPRWVTLTGLGAAAVGVLLITRGAASPRANRTTVVLFGVVLLELGGVAICPALIGAAGRLGGRLPALPRLALRDAARQRARSGPAVAAIAAAVSGAIAVSVYVASSNLHQQRIFAPQLPRDAVTVSDTRPIDSADLVSVLGTAAAARVIPDRAVHGYTEQVLRPSPTGGLDPGNAGDVIVGNVSLLQRLGASASAQQAFQAGSSVSGGLGPVGTLQIQPDTPGSQPPVAVAGADAGWGSPQLKPALIIPAATAAHLRLSIGNYEYRALLNPGLSNPARKAIQGRAWDLGLYATVDTGPLAPNNLVSLALLGIAVLFSLVVTAAATALAATESRSDLAIMGAVGATGRVRRFFTAAQGSTTALLGAILGIAIGVVPGIAVVHASLEKLPLVLPWQPFVAFLVGLPLLAGLGGLLFSRSRLPGAPRVL